MRGMTELSLGQLDAALSDGEQALARKPNVADAHMLLALALGARSARHGWLQRQARGEDVTRGLEHLDRALQYGYSRLDVVRHDPRLEPLRRDRRFAEIMGRRPNH